MCQSVEVSLRHVLACIGVRAHAIWTEFRPNQQNALLYTIRSNCVCDDVSSGLVHTAHSRENGRQQAG
eukprot:COSAG06_NODE_629_length_13646_cov_13.351222_4_plen_68_part_00